MGEDGRIVYKVTIDDSGVTAEAEHAGQQAGEGINKGASPGASTFHEMMVGVARRIGEAFVEMAAKAVDGIKQIVQAGIDFNAKMESYQTAFTTLLGNAEAADAVMAQIRKDAASTPFDVDSLTQANSMLISAGVSAEEARADVLNLANAIAATGGGSAELSRMAANLQQVKNVGKATAMDVRQFAMAGINIYGLLADATGKTTEEVQDMEVSYELLTQALAKAGEEGGKYYGAMEAQSQTFSGKLSTLKDNATQLAGTLTQDLFAKLSGTALPLVMDWVATLLDAASTNGIEGALAAAGDILKTLIDKIIDALPQMLDTGMKLLESLISGIGDAIPGITQIVLSIFSALLTAIASHIPEIILAGVDVLMGLINGIVTAIPMLVQMLPQVISALVGGLLTHLPQIVSAGIQLLVAVITGILQSIPQLVSALPQVIRAILDAFAKTDWLAIGKGIVNGIWAGIKSLSDWLVNKVKDFASSIWNGAKKILGIASPSKKFKYIGEMSVEGTAEGFEDQEAKMTRTVRTLYTGIVDTAKKSLKPIYETTPWVPPMLDAPSLERDVSYKITAAGATTGATIIVPLSLDGREIARATAWSMGEQLAWEEM